MKHVQLFENFKLNEEAPFNLDAYKNDTDPKWTKTEYNKLKKYGADSIDRYNAYFKEKAGIFIITKKKNYYDLSIEGDERYYGYSYSLDDLFEAFKNYIIGEIDMIEMFNILSTEESDD